MGNGILAVFGVGIMSLVCHYLPLAKVGEWFFFLSILSICDAVRNGFLGTATVKFYAGTDGIRADTVLGSVWVLAFCITAIVLILNLGVYWFFRHSENEELFLTVKWLGLTYLSALPFSVIFWILQAKEDYAGILWLRLVNSGSMIIVFGVLVYMKCMSIQNALLYNFLTNCLTSIVGLLWGAGRIQNMFKSTKECVLEIVHFGKFSLATNLSSNLLRNTDAFIITYMLGTTALAVYNLPVRLMEIIEIPLRSFASTGMSSMAAAFNNNDIGKLTYILKKYAGMLTMIFIPAALIAFLFAGVAIRLLGGLNFSETSAANIYRLLMFFAIMAPIDRFNGVTLDIIHKPKINFYKVLVMLAVNIVCDFGGVLALHNIYGIVLGGFLTIVSGIVFGYINLSKYIDYTIPGILKTGYTEMVLFIRENLGIRPHQ